MFDKLTAFFRRKKKQEQPNTETRYANQNTATRHAKPTPQPVRSSTNTRDDSGDLLNPMNPFSPIWHGGSSANASDSCSSSSSGYDSGGSSSSSCDSGSSSGSSDSGSPC